VEPNHLRICPTLRGLALLHPDTELRFINSTIGYGVFATRLIPAGSITWARDDLDQVFTPGQIAERPPLLREILDRYCFYDGAGNWILCWDLARFVNHNCDANCLSAGFDFEIAVRDIQADDELTDDYGTLNLLEPFECHCGAASCRGVLQPGDPEQLMAQWDARVQAVFPRLHEVKQPLAEFVREPEAVRQALETGETPSCRTHLLLLNGRGLQAAIPELALPRNSGASDDR
jgi:hypothetical protein